jgi:hypothetical protein
MKVLFKNKSKIETIDAPKSIRGVRSNFINCVCYDIQDDCWVFVIDLDLRKPFDRFIPEWVVDAILKEI